MARKLSLMVALGVLVTIVVGFGQAPAGETRRTIYMSAVEYKGGANVADEAYPPLAVEGTKRLQPLGGGYNLKGPDETGRWEVESYRFEPGFLVARLGERVALEIVGINGARHDIELVSPSGKTTEVVVTRGRMTRVPFQAEELGVWRLVCNTHRPAMVSEILVIR